MRHLAVNIEIQVQGKSETKAKLDFRYNGTRSTRSSSNKKNNRRIRSSWSKSEWLRCELFGWSKFGYENKAGVCVRVRLCARMCVSEIESVLLYERMCVCNDGRNVRMSVCRIQSTCQEAKPQDCIVFFTRWLIPNAKQGLLLDFVALRSKCAWTRT